MSLLFNTEIYLFQRGEGLMLLGVQLLALNRFLAGYLGSDEPYPPTYEFFQAVQESIDQEVFPDYVPGAWVPDTEEEMEIRLPDNRDIIATSPDIPEGMEAALDMDTKIKGSRLGVAAYFAATRKKKFVAGYLVNMAKICFLIGRNFKIFARIAGHYDNYLPSIDHLIASAKPPEGKKKIEINPIHQLDREDAAFLASMEKLFERTNEEGVRLEIRGYKELGYWQRWILENRGHKGQATPAAGAARTCRQNRKKQACEIFISLRINPNTFKSDIAKKIQNRWVLDPEKKNDKVPSIKTIIRYLQEAGLLS